MGRQTDTIYDRPLFKDWLTYWSLFLLWGAIGSVWQNYGGMIVSDVEAVAFLIDAALRTTFYIGLFAVVPGVIRRSRRRSKAETGTLASGSGRPIDYRRPGRWRNG